MPVVQDEQTIKGKSQFLDYEAGDGNSLMLRSHLYMIYFHWLEGARKYVACRENDCVFCNNGYEVNHEYNYMVDLNGQKGFMNIKGSVFFAIQKIAKAQKKDPRQISWTVIKTGEGKGTKYTVSKDDNLAPEDYEALKAELNDNTKKLTELMAKQEARFDENYIACMGLARPQQKVALRTNESAIEAEQKRAIAEEATAEGSEPPVNPEDIPF